MSSGLPAVAFGIPNTLDFAHSSSPSAHAPDKAKPMIQGLGARVVTSLLLAGLAIWLSGAPRRGAAVASAVGPPPVTEAREVSFGDPEILVPVGLEVDPGPPASGGNGVFEPGEAVTIAPTWQNYGETAETVEGIASNFIGPDGELYSIEAGAASYGEIQPGEDESCAVPEDCYRLRVDEPAVRPQTHWDATFVESLDDLDGTTRTRTLHIGASFVDLAPTHPFYSAIETLLHHGVTGGCTGSDGNAGGAQYCPDSTFGRAQLAVFVLRALAGADYVPPTCAEGDEMFADVPASSPFCPWIEELFRRDVVAGCGDGNYCPGRSVSRAQVAVFLFKTLLGGDFTPPPCTGMFDDVPCPSTFADWIEAMAARGITAGCSATEYCPEAPLSRGQMAALISKAAGLALYGPSRPAAVCGPKPDASNTGPRFTIERTLTSSEALAELRATGELSRVRITGTLTLDGADGVGWVISDSILEPRDSWYGVRAYTNEPFTGSPSERPRFEHVEVRGAGATGHSNSSASFYGNDTIWRWSELYGDVDLFKVRHRVLIENTYAHDTYYPEGAHSDVVQIRSGVGSRFRCNNFVATVGYGTNVGGNANAVLQTGSVIGSIESEWHHNWVTGGHYTIRVGDCDSNVDYWFSGNRHGRVFTYGPVAGCSDGKTAGDNVWDDTGEILW